MCLINGPLHSSDLEPIKLWIITVISLQIWGGFRHYFFQTFCFSFLTSQFGTSTMHMLVHWLESFRSLSSVHFSSVFCSLILRPDNFHHLVYKFTDFFSVHPNLTLNPPSGFFLYQPFYFQFQISFCSIMFSTSLIYISPLLMLFIFLTFSMLSFSSSNVFKIVI